MNRPYPGERVSANAVPPLRGAMTEVELIWIEKRLEHWIRFGRIAGERIVSRKTRIVSFRPNAIFALIRWASNDFGTIHSRIDILRAVGAHEAYTTAPFVRPDVQQGWLATVLAEQEVLSSCSTRPSDVRPVRRSSL